MPAAKISRRLLARSRRQSPWRANSQGLMKPICFVESLRRGAPGKSAEKTFTKLQSQVLQLFLAQRIASGFGRVGRVVCSQGEPCPRFCSRRISGPRRGSTRTRCHPPARRRNCLQCNSAELNVFQHGRVANIFRLPAVEEVEHCSHGHVLDAPAALDRCRR